MHRVKVHKYAGVLSAYGLVLADVVNEQQEAWMKPIDGQFLRITIICVKLTKPI
jgi:N-methylhydantoinase A/oxoprolinase/acetone carboxylase beta subunit